MGMRPYDECPHIPLNTQLEVVLPARLIPPGATVRKLTGKAKHTLVKRLRIYPKKGAEGDKQIIEGKAGCVFLESEGQEGTFSVYPPDHKFVWIVSMQDLLDQMEWQGMHKK